MWLKIYYDKLGLVRGGCYEKKLFSKASICSLGSQSDSCLFWFKKGLEVYCEK